MPSAVARRYRLDPAPLLELESWISHHHRVWEARLDKLGRHLDAMAEREKGSRR